MTSNRYNVWLKVTVVFSYYSCIYFNVWVFFDRNTLFPANFRPTEWEKLRNDTGRERLSMQKFTFSVESNNLNNVGPDKYNNTVVCMTSGEITPQCR